MAKKPTSDLTHLPSQDPESGETIAIVETPRGSRNKYAYDPKFRALVLKSVLPQGSVFPFDFGFIPSTVADDGDPLDVLLLLDDPVPPSSVVTVRLIGAIEAKQKEKDGEWVRNDRLVAVATHAHQHGEVNNIKEISPHILDEIEAFFAHYDKLEGKEFKVVDRVGPKAAGKLLKKAERTEKRH
ncbi:MAG: inorganic diphosphatase [Beijerinckiaceae bacterium]